MKALKSGNGIQNVALVVLGLRGREISGSLPLGFLEAAAAIPRARCTPRNASLDWDAAAASRKPRGREPLNFPAAKAEYDKGNVLDAISDFKAFIEQYPGHRPDDDALYYLGLCYIHEKDYAWPPPSRPAARDFPTSPLQPDALVDLARCDDLQSHPAALDQTETERALQRYSQFVDQYPEHARGAGGQDEDPGAARPAGREAPPEAGGSTRSSGAKRRAEFYLRRVAAEYPESKWVRRRRRFSIR